MLHKPNNNNIIQALSATRHSRVEAQYAKTTTTYSAPTQYTGGWGRAMLMIEHNTYNNNTDAQCYKYANAVINEDTGNVLDLKKLLKDPKYSETWSKAASNEYGRLFQGCGRSNVDGSQRIVGMNTCHWIKKE
jgi:hypothetical protein